MLLVALLFSTSDNINIKLLIVLVLSLNLQETGGYYAFVEFEEVSGVHNALKVTVSINAFQIIVCVSSFSFLCVFC